MSQATQTTISTAGDTVALPLQQQGPAGPDGVAAFTGSGTFTSVVVSVQGRLKSTAAWVKLAVIKRSGDGSVKYGNITLDDSTAFDLFVPNVSMYSDLQLYYESGTGSVVCDGESAPASIAPIIMMTPAITIASTPQTISAASATALVVGPNGTTNPTLTIVTNTSSAANGLTITSSAAGSGVALLINSSTTNEPLSINTKGSGILDLQTTGTGIVRTGTGITVTAGNLILTSGNATLTSGNLALTSGNATLTSGNLLLSAGTATVTSANASAFAVGRLGATTPGLVVDASTSTCITGLKITPKGTGSGVALTAVGETNVGIDIAAAGSGVITIAGSGTGTVIIGSGTNGPVVLKGTLTAGGLLTCALQVATSGPLIYTGSSTPSISAAVKGSLYLSTSGSSSSTRLYVATDTAGGWAAITTAS